MAMQTRDRASRDCAPIIHSLRRPIGRKGYLSTRAPLMNLRDQGSAEALTTVAISSRDAPLAVSQAGMAKPKRLRPMP